MKETKIVLHLNNSLKSKTRQKQEEDQHLDSVIITIICLSKHLCVMWLIGFTCIRSQKKKKKSEKTAWLGIRPAQQSGEEHTLKQK